MIRERPPLKRDIEKAKKLLAEAGYKDGLTVEIANGDTEGPWMTDACANDGVVLEDLLADGHLLLALAP